LKGSRSASQAPSSALGPGVQAPARTSRSSRRVDALLNGAIVLVAGFGLLSSVLPVFGNSLYASGGRYDFGSVKAGEVVKHRFSVRNLHPWPVTVTDVQSDCGCTKSFPDRKPPFRLAPLQSASIDASVDTSAKSGHVAQTLIVTTSDNPSGTLLSIKGEVH